MSGVINGVQAKVRDCYKYAYFVHCYAHQLNLIMERAAKQNTKARVFFANLTSIPAFFSRSPHRQSVLDSCVSKKIPSAGATRWNFKIRTVNVVHEKKESLLECFETIMESETSNDITINEASALVRTLEDPEFNFWLSFFHLLMPHVDILYNQLQHRQLDVSKVQIYISTFVHAVQKIRNSDQLSSENCENENPSKRRKVGGSQTRVAAAKEVCDLIITQANTRFQFIDHLTVASLLCQEKFECYRSSFPENDLNLCVKLFPMFDKDKLKTELTVLYQRQEFRNMSGAVKLLQFLLTENLHTSFSEVVKLLRIAITISMTTSEPERCFSCL